MKPTARVKLPSLATVESVRKRAYVRCKTSNYGNAAPWRLRSRLLSNAAKTRFGIVYVYIFVRCNMNSDPSLVIDTTLCPCETDRASQREETRIQQPWKSRQTPVRTSNYHCPYRSVFRLRAGLLSTQCYLRQTPYQPAMSFSTNRW
jgi:hypothetical protein